MKTIKITLKNWHYQCSDGCCDNYGTEVLVNGTLLDHPEGLGSGYVGDDVELSLRAVLEHLGYNVLIENKYD